VAVSGPFRTDGKRAKIAALSRGAAARFPFKVNAVEGGRHVPVSVHTTYSYLDGLGSVRTGRQGDGLEVAVMERGAPPQGASPVRTVLFLAASPKDMEPLRPDLELRMVDEQMQLDRNRDDFRLESHVAARLTDISRSLVRYKPHVVHFSGHGDAYGRLYVEDERGFSKPVNPEGLAKMFGLYKATIQCVVVNACHSIRLAEAMSEHIDYVVGMRSQVGDSAAILFSVGFYQALFGGENVPDAFKLACSLLQSDEETEREYQTPVLYPPGLG
jgi:hypothetical protein